VTDDTRYRAVCDECGNQSELVAHAVVAEDWADEHREACAARDLEPRDVRVEEVDA